MKHKNTKPLYIFNRENPQNSELQNGPRRRLDFIALDETHHSIKAQSTISPFVSKSPLLNSEENFLPFFIYKFFPYVFYDASVAATPQNTFFSSKNWWPGLTIGGCVNAFTLGP